MTGGHDRNQAGGGPGTHGGNTGVPVGLHWPWEPSRRKPPKNLPTTWPATPAPLSAVEYIQNHASGLIRNRLTVLKHVAALVDQSAAAQPGIPGVAKAARRADGRAGSLDQHVADQAGIPTITVKRAMAWLQANGWLVKTLGGGYIVAGSAVHDGASCDQAACVALNERGAAETREVRVMWQEAIEAGYAAESRRRAGYERSKKGIPRGTPASRAVPEIRFLVTAEDRAGIGKPYVRFSRPARF